MKPVAAVFVLFALLSLLLAAAPARAQSPDCGPAVQRVDGALEVTASNDDDTANIQCAFDEATRLGIPTVRLQRSEYAVTRLEVVDFNGSFEGGGADNTTLVLFDAGIECSLMELNGQVPAGLKFIRGNVKVARMTIGAANPCIEQNIVLFLLVHFTGQASGATCDSETGFGLVDRADLVGLGGNPSIWAIGSLAEGYVFGNCNDTLLGTFKLNRSLVAGFGAGVALSLRGSGQVDINFNEFFDSFSHVYVENANQLLTIQGNDFFSNDLPNANHASVELWSNEVSPDQNRAVVFRNRFDLDSTDNQVSISGVAAFKSSPMNLSLVVTDNRFTIDAPFSAGVFVQDTDGASISGNRFIGSPYTGIFLQGGGAGSTVTANVFSENLPGFADIYLDEATSGVISALNVAAIVADDGIGNLVLEPVQAESAPISQAAAIEGPPVAAGVDRARLSAAQARVAAALKLDTQILSRPESQRGGAESRGRLLGRLQHRDK